MSSTQPHVEVCRVWRRYGAARPFYLYEALRRQDIPNRSASVLAHELGHVLGLDHDSGLSVMQDSLDQGVRRWAGDTLTHVDDTVVTAAAQTQLLNRLSSVSDSVASTSSNSARATHADVSRNLSQSGIGSLIDWAGAVPVNGRPVELALQANHNQAWVKSFLTSIGQPSDEDDVNHELEVTMPGLRAEGRR